MHGASARCQHWVNNNHWTRRNVLWKVRVIVNGQFCMFVALNSNMTNAGFWKEPQNSIGHAKASTQNGNKRDGLRKTLALRRFKWSLHGV